MSTRNTVLRSMHDVGLAAWFGGTLMGVVGLNGAAEDQPNQLATARVSGNGWNRWAPVNGFFVGMHLVGGAGILLANRKRAVLQKGVRANTVTKLIFTGAALAATGYVRVLGKKIDADVAKKPLSTAEDSADVASSHSLPGDADSAQRQMRILQWSLPALTAGLEILNAQQGEQQRPNEQLRGFTQRAGELVGLG